LGYSASTLPHMLSAVPVHRQSPSVTPPRKCTPAATRASWQTCRNCDVLASAKKVSAVGLRLWLAQAAALGPAKHQRGADGAAAALPQLQPPAGGHVMAISIRDEEGELKGWLMQKRRGGGASGMRAGCGMACCSAGRARPHSVKTRQEQTLPEGNSGSLLVSR
jgi:hypothetical protein